MGHQHLLLIILSVIITSMSIAVALSQFYVGASEANRDAVIMELVNHAAKAQRYFYTPNQLGGGSRNFNGFSLYSAEVSNLNGNYQVSATAPSGTTPVTPGGSISVNATTIYIIGSGKEKGNDGSNPVKAYATVTANTIVTAILN